MALTDFRNYDHTVWSPSAPITILTGENGSGKTNLLEAISLLAPGRGLRGAPMALLTRRGAARWGVSATFDKGHDQIRIATGSDPAGSARRIFRLDGENVRSHGEIGQLFSCVWLTPQMDRLFVEGASGRRRFLDRLVMALTPDHARQIAAHDRSVSSRNRVLADRPGEQEWLAAIEDSIARHAVAATAARLMLVEKMNEHGFENEGFPSTDITLECEICTRLRHQSALHVEDWIRERLADTRAQDRARAGTSVGAHRADFVLTDVQSGRGAEISSSGQQKAMLLGIVLAHARLIAGMRGEPPFILLDEPLLHLDDARRIALLDSLRIAKAPVFLTGTDPEPFAALTGHAAFVTVRSGALTPA